MPLTVVDPTTLGIVGTIATPPTTSVAYPQFAEVYQKFPEKDGYGGHRLVLALIGLYKCRIEKATKFQENRQGAGTESVTTYQIYFDLGDAPRIFTSQRLRIGNQGFEVVSTDRGKDGTSKLTVVALEVGTRGL